MDPAPGAARDEMARLAGFGSEGFRAVCALIEVGPHHYRTVELLQLTYRPGDERHLLVLAKKDGLPNFASWSVLEGLGVADTDAVRTFLLDVLRHDDDAGEFMAAAKGLAVAKPPAPKAASQKLRRWTVLVW